MTSVALNVRFFIINLRHDYRADEAGPSINQHARSLIYEVVKRDQQALESLCICVISSRSRCL